jgi:hypothetical protein
MKCSLCEKEGHRSDNKKFHPVVPKMEISELEKANIEIDALKARLHDANIEIEALKAILAKNVCKTEPQTSEYVDVSIYGKLKQIGDNLYAEQNAANSWRGTPLESINELKPDPAGKVGEELLKTICLACGIKNENTGDKNSKDGTYDQKVGDSLKKVEIKTARVGRVAVGGKSGKYQHETLKMKGCDYWVFIDINPNGGCVTILPLFDLNSKHPITGTAPSLRKGTTDVFKWDFTEHQLDKFVSAECAMRFDKNTEMSQLGDFIKLKIN